MGKGLQILGEFGGSTISVDSTLTTEGMAADAKAVGDGLAKKLSIPETASVGQTIVVSEVDANGKPTAWAPADLPDLPTGGGGSNEWKLIRTVTIPEDITTDTSGVNFRYPTPDAPENGVWFGFDTDENGQPFECRELLVFCEKAGTPATLGSPSMCFNKAIPSYEASIGFELGCSVNGKTSYSVARFEQLNIGKGFSYRAVFGGGSANNIQTSAKVGKVTKTPPITALFAIIHNAAAYGYLPNSTFIIYGR